VFDSKDYMTGQSRKRIFALSTYVGKKTAKTSNTLNTDCLKNLEIYKPKCYYKKINQIIDFTNKKFPDEVTYSLMKNTPSRVRMSNNRILIPNRMFTPTVTTKQDRLPNTGTIPFKNNISGYLNYRFLTPRECYLLMGFTNIDFENVQKRFGTEQVEIGMNSAELIKWGHQSEKVNLITAKRIKLRDKLYRQAGNSISVQVLEMIFYTIEKGA